MNAKHTQPSWVNTRGLDAETVVEFSSILFSMGLSDCFEEHFDAVREVFDAVKKFQEEHATTNWKDRGDYWDEVERHCNELMQRLRGNTVPGIEPTPTSERAK